MTLRTGRMLVASLALVLAWGVASVYRLRVARGDVFPEYSTLRADPLGTRALHDAARRLPGRRVERWTRPLARLEAGAGDLIVLAGVRRDLASEDWDALDRATIAGASVVVALRAEKSEANDGVSAREIRADPWLEEPAPVAADKGGKNGEKPAPAERKGAEAREDEEDGKDEASSRAGRRGEPPPRHASEHERRWGYRLARRELVKRGGNPDAVRDAAAPAAWPAALASWRSDLFFLPRPADGWLPLYRRGGDVVMMRRARGAGRVTLLADSFVLSNEAAHRDRPTVILADLLGDAPRVVFVESHLGVETETGVAILARRYGLGGAAGLGLALAALWFWRRASPLAPVPPEEDELRLAIAPTAGLEAVLRRAVPPGELHAACLSAWRATAGASDRRRLEGAALPDVADPVAAHRAAARALSKRTFT